MNSPARGRNQRNVDNTTVVNRAGASHDDVARKRAIEVRCRPLASRAARTNLPPQPISQATINSRSTPSCGALRIGTTQAKKPCKKSGQNGTTMIDLAEDRLWCHEPWFSRGLLHAPSPTCIKSAQFE